MPVRLLLGSGLVLAGSRPAGDDHCQRELRLDDADPRLRPRRRGHRHDQPAAGLDRHRRGAARAQRHGLGHQLHVPPGRHRHRHRRARRDLPAQRHQQHPRHACRQRARAAKSRMPPTASSATILESGEVAHFARTLSPAAHTALVHSYRVGFTGAFTTIAIIAALVALVGGALAFILVRGRDFVSSGQASPAADAPETAARGRTCRLTRMQRITPSRHQVTHAPGTPGTKAPAGAGSADRSGPRESAGTARMSSRGCCARAAGTRTYRRAPRRTVAAPHRGYLLWT